MSQSVGDLGLQYHFTGNRESGGIYGLIDTYSNSTDEEKKLLSNECKIRLECCRCGNFFLSHSELLKHKQNYCRPLYSTIASSHSVVAVPAFAEKTHTGKQFLKRDIIQFKSHGNHFNLKKMFGTITTLQSAIIKVLPRSKKLRNADHGKKERTSPSQQDRGEIRISGTKTDSQSPKRAKIILKRTDVVNVVNKHRKHCTLSQSNLEIMESIPYALVTVDTMPPDRFPVLIPQDNSGCYREMNLRNRGSDSSKNGIARKVGSEETVEIRGRSLSPLSDDFLETEESSDGSEEIGYDSAPVLEPIANMETENIELTVKDRMDYIIAVVCSDVKKAQVNNKYELNIQLNPEKLDPSVSKKKKSPSIWLRTARKRMVENVTMGQLAGPSKAESYKCRPSRQRRKPNWIDENYWLILFETSYLLMKFRNKRARRDDDDIDLECAQPKRQSRPSSRSGKSRSSRTESKYARSADSQRLTPVEPCSTILGIQSEASSEETSN
uniref:C2H2-type domain-containing protein n=1 Tax=Elaeophora elaphi TaxID=1147741 RepID=A0A0R3S7D3_9BILA